MNPFPFLSAWRRDDTSAAKLYGSIVAQARLPVFYQGVGVPDTLQGRFVVLSLQLFAVLHRLKAEGPPAHGLAQDLIDRFGADMETVLREIGIGDLSIPKKVRALAASSGALLQAYAEALAEGEAAVAAVIAEALPLEAGASGAVARRLAHYLRETLSLLRAQDFAALRGGRGEISGGDPRGRAGRRVDMTSETEPAPLSRIFKVDEIKDGASGEIIATEAEMDAIAGLLDLVRLEGLTFDYRFNHGGSGRLRLTGRLKADVTQTCVVSLDPVDARIDVPLEIEFWPEALLQTSESSAELPGSVVLLDGAEPIVCGQIDLGRVAYETLATSLDPYPKREGVSFDWSQGEPNQAQEAQSGPFAALAALKRGERQA